MSRLPSNAAPSPFFGLLRGESPDSLVFRDGLRGFGCVDGRNVVIEQRWADGYHGRLRDLAADLVRLKVDIRLGLAFFDRSGGNLDEVIQ